jgi:hypothetical protein
MAFTLTIGAVSHQVQIDSLNINESLAGFGTLAGTFITPDGAFQEALDEELVLERDSDVMFRGFVRRSKLRGADGPGGDGGDATALEVLADDYSALLFQNIVTATIAAGTNVKTALIALVAEVDEIDVAVGQVNGPALPQLVFTRAKVRDAIDEVVRHANAASGPGWFLKTTPDQEVEIVAPNAYNAPWNLIQGEGSECGDLEVEDERGDDYANQVTVEGGTVNQIERVEDFPGDGLTTVFQLEYRPYRHYGYVSNSGTGNNETLGPVGDPDLPFWEIDMATGVLTKAQGGAPANGSTISIKFDGTHDIVGFAEDVGAQAPPTGVRPVTEQVDGLSTTAEANAAAEALLLEYSASQKKATYPTRRDGLRPGMKQTITAAKRGASGSWFVTDMITTYDGAVINDGLVCQVTAAKSNVVRGNFRSTYRRWDELGAGAAAPAPAAAVSPGAGSSSAGPGSPNRSVQFNRAGVFGGDQHFRYFEDENSLVMGEDCEITAALFESAFAGGVNCQIEDP